MADMPSGTILCPHGPRSWHAAAFTHPLGSVFHGHSRTTVMCMVGGVCALCLSLRMLGCPASPSRRGCPFCDRSTKGTVSALSTEADILGNFKPGLLRFSRRIVIFQMGGAVCCISGGEQP